MAEGIFRQRAQDMGLDLNFDSAGTGGWHIGEQPDNRMMATAKQRGVDISDLRARQFELADFDRFDRIYAMDQSNLQNILKLARDDYDRKKVSLLLDVLYPGQDQSVPDPYFGGQRGFEDVFDMIDEAAHKILTEE